MEGSGSAGGADGSRPAGVSLPAGVADRARDLAAGRLAVVPARDAATVVLLRDRAGGPEAYLLRRVPTMAFAAGMYVFPGGRVDERDEHAGDGVWHGQLPETWAGALHAEPALADALVCAAVRETFEESGVLLAGTAPRAGGGEKRRREETAPRAGGGEKRRREETARDDTSPHLVADTRGADWEADRQALIDRSLPFAAMLRRRGLTLRADLLRPWAHWITPEVEPRRYDTRFFVAELPAGQRTRDVGGEADQVAWMRPGDAVAQAERGELELLPPTVATLSELAAYRSVGDAFAAAARRTIRPIMPRLRVGPGGDLALLFPGDEGYDEAAPPP